MRIPELSLVALMSLLVASAGVPAFAQAVDPPAMAAVPVRGSQVIRLNVVCFDHEVGLTAPSPCRGELMLHDAGGRQLKRETYELQPGQATFLQLTVPTTSPAGSAIGRIAIVPCVIPAPGGRVPSVEVFDREAGRVVAFAHPAAARTSEFNNGRTAPGDDAGFDPQPDPPGFGVVTLRGDQTMRLNVACFNHEGNGEAPSACQGGILVHDAAGNVLRRGTYDLAPGQTRSFEFVPPTTRGSFAAIIPCVLPAPGGRAVPSLEVLDSTGNVALLVGPAVARMSQFQHVESPR